MKTEFHRCSTYLTIAFLSVWSGIGYAENPVVQTVFTADPAPLVYDGTVYLYTGQDEDNAPDDRYLMHYYRCYTTTDMVNWTDHGAVIDVREVFDWSGGDANAAQCIYRNGKFYYYVSTGNAKGPGGVALGVAIADSPLGPFTDALGKALVTNDQTKYAQHGWDDLDPTVFIDDDGSAFLYWGNNACYYAELNDDMISLKTEIKAVPLEKSTIGPDFEEAPWNYKRNGLYYMIYASEFPELIRYSTATSPIGPWTYRGLIMDKPHEEGLGTVHPGIIDYKGHSYFFYHSAALPGGGDKRRCVCIEQFEYNGDNTIPYIERTTTGAAQIEHLDPYDTVQAETICWASGIETEPCSEGGINVCDIDNGDYIKVKGVDFGAGASSFQARVSSGAAGGSIEVRLDSPTGILAGTCDVSSTGGWQQWRTKSCVITGASGVHDLYLVFTGGAEKLFAMNWWKLEDQ